jgi:hypothetical protein
MNLDTALRRASAGLHRTQARYRPAQLRDFTFSDRQALAEYISGSRERKSQTYRTAMREIQRAERGARVGPRYLSKFNAYASRLARSYVVVDFSGTIRISSEVSHRNIRGVGGSRYMGLLPESALDSDAAFHDRISGFFAVYGVPMMMVADPPAPDAVEQLTAVYV